MSFDFEPLRDKALQIVGDFGRQAGAQILRNIEGAPADPTKPWRASASSLLTFQFIGVITTIGFPRGNRDPSADGDTDIIVPGSIVDVLADEDGVTLCGAPTLLDRVQSVGIQYTILGIQDITPNDKPIIYKLRCRAWPTIAPSAPNMV